MHIHISKKMLKETRFSVEKFGDKININGYREDEIKGESCSKCLLKKFKNNEIINIKDLVTDKSCGCEPAIMPLMSIKLDPKNTETITIV